MNPGAEYPACAVTDPAGDGINNPAILKLPPGLTDSGMGLSCCRRGMGELVRRSTLLPNTRPPAPLPDGQEQRRHPRFERSGSVSIFPYNPGGTVGKAIQVQLRDISADGIGLTHAGKLEPGNQFVISLERPGHEMAVIVYRVVHCRDAGTEGFHIGAAVAEVHREQELLADDASASGLARFGRILRLRRQPS